MTARGYLGDCPVQGLSPGKKPESFPGISG